MPYCGIAEIFPFLMLPHEIICRFRHQNRFALSHHQRGGPAITQCSVLCLRKQALLHGCTMHMFLHSRMPAGNLSCMRTNKDESQQPELNATLFLSPRVMAPAAACSAYTQASVQEKHSNLLKSWGWRRVSYQQVQGFCVYSAYVFVSSLTAARYLCRYFWPVLNLFNV